MMEISKDRLYELLNECVTHIRESAEDDEECVYIFRHLGFSQKEMENFDIIPSLPSTITVSVSDIGYEEDWEELEDAISDYLSDEYGYCHFGFNYTFDEYSGEITITDIDWDIS